MLVPIEGDGWRDYADGDGKDDRERGRHGIIGNQTGFGFVKTTGQGENEAGDAAKCKAAN